ncbi:peptidoglycan D,D-transpeptidase FtsI family protein [Microbacterium sp. CJ88]|uniref:peptidoglycan D,D-transpeptidase FtsI family protein n=1 Tax=Microbacterium sp. CJ88 TaxID=3445672 RepID=UPI003F657B7C
MTTRATRSPRRRTVVALGVVLAVLSAFIVRLVDIQVVNADQHVQEASALSLGGASTLYGTRGAIVDQTGKPLADSILLYDAQLSPINVQNYTVRNDAGDRVSVPIADTAAKIAAVTGQTPDEVKKIVDDALAVNPNNQYALLKKSISTQMYRALADLNLPFLYFTQHPSRTYPDGAVGGNLVGYLNIDGQPLSGLEQSQQACLASTDGQQTFQRGKDGVMIPGTEVTKPAVDGGTLQLTINRDLQWYLQQLAAEQGQNMGAKRATITVVEAKTGKIRAAAEWPAVDPNNVSASPVEDQYSHIFTDRFEPGSTFKGLTASTVIDAGGQHPDSTVSANGLEIFPNGARIRDADLHPTYNYTLAGVLIDSSNVGISKFSEKVDNQTRFDYFQRFGIGQGSAVGFPGEQTGVVYPAAQWDNQTQYNTAFGQGVETTVPELVGAYAAIANGGTKMPLSLVESCTKSDGTVVAPDLPQPTQVITPDTSAQMRQILENVGLQASYADMIKVPGYRIAVKTGTGEKSDGNGGYKAGVYFTTMIGFAPADDPQYVVAVTLDEPTTVTSSAANAPAFQKAMTQVLKTYRVMPSTTEPTLLPKFG